MQRKPGKRVYKDHQFKVRLTKTQLEAVRDAADRNGLSVTAWAVQCLLKAATQGDETRLRGNVSSDAVSDGTVKKNTKRPESGARRAA
jgi:hypothetical protein